MRNLTCHLLAFLGADLCAYVWCVYLCVSSNASQEQLSVDILPPVHFCIAKVKPLWKFLSLSFLTS